MTNAMVLAVRNHALANYEKDGWDYVVESWDDEDILEAIVRCKTPVEAIRFVGNCVKLLADYRDEIRAEEW
jgi:hypothetical protein